MKQSVNERIQRVVDLFLTYHYVDYKRIVQELKISKRTAYYTIEELNKIFQQYHLPWIDTVYGKGMYLSEEQKKFVKQQSFTQKEETLLLESDELIATIFFVILHSKKTYYMYQFEEMFSLSRFTINTNMNKLKNILHKFSIKLDSSKNGYFIQGKEKNVRKAFFYLFPSIMNIFKLKNFWYMLSDVEFKTIMELEESILTFKQRHHIAYSESSITAIACLLYRAVCLKHEMDSMDDFILENDVVRHSYEYQYINSHFPSLSLQNKNYFSVVLYCSRLNACVTTNVNVKELVNDLIDAVSSITGVEIYDEELWKNLCRHLNISFIRYQYGILIDNPLIDDIKKQYGEYFSIVKQATNALNVKFQGLITDNEIGFLTLYFVGIFQERKIENRLKILVVCLNGLATSYLLKKELEMLDHRIEIIDSISMNQLDQYAQYDFIISTIELDAKYKHIVVNPILSIEDKIKILSYLNQYHLQNPYPSIEEIVKIVKPYIKETEAHLLKQDLTKLYCSTVKKDFSDLFKQEFVTIYKNTDETWKELLVEASKPLLLNGYIAQEYVEEIIHNIDEYGSYMVYPNGYLLAHASAEHSYRLGLSVLLLDKEVEVAGNMVSKIFMLTPYNYTAHLSVLNKLIKLFKHTKMDHSYHNFDVEELFLFINNQLV